MIWYDSHQLTTLLRMTGSILPKSMRWAVPSAALAFTLRYLEEQGIIHLDDLDVLSHGDVYSGFTFVLGFSLVFRTSQSYLRYWTAATSVHEMSCEWSDSCASLIAFVGMSPATNADKAQFRHTVVRLFSLLHAMALTEVANVKEFVPLLDINGLSKEHLFVLTQNMSQGKKVQIVMAWIKGFIIEMGESGVLSVPAPILTRVFHELGNGLVAYHRALQIVIWPFPFPYTQLNFLLIQVYVLITPVVVSSWGAWAWVCSLFTFVSVTCMVGLDQIACELENPFGDDPNDLPVVDMQKDMNKFLLMMLNPAVHQPPRLQPEATIDFRKMVSEDGRTDLSSESFAQTGSRRAIAQDRWRGMLTPQGEINDMQHWLGLDHITCLTPELDEEDDEQLRCSFQGTFEYGQPVPGARSSIVEDWGETRGEAKMCDYASMLDWRAFLDTLDTKLTELMESQLQVHRKQLSAMEAMFGKFSPARDGLDALSCEENSDLSSKMSEPLRLTGESEGVATADHLSDDEPERENVAFPPRLPAPMLMRCTMSMSGCREASSLPESAGRS